MSKSTTTTSTKISSTKSPKSSTKSSKRKFDDIGFPAIETDIIIDEENHQTYDPITKSISTIEFGGSESNENDENNGNEEQHGKKSSKKKTSGGAFQTMGFCYEVYRGILKKGYKLPTPIQRKTIPHILAGKDIVAMARTGSGKTAAFVLPMLQKLKSHKSIGSRALIISPTRELAQQTEQVILELGKFTDLTSACLIGGDAIESQFQSLSKCPDIIVAVPGRLVHLLIEVKDFSLKYIEYLVYDEADRLFEMGFGPQINEIMKRMNDYKQTLLFSATLPTLLLEFTRAGLKDPVSIRLDSDVKISNMLQMMFFTCRADEKAAILMYVLSHIIPDKHQTIIFAATRQTVEWLSSFLTKLNYRCAIVYGKMEQVNRTVNVQRFRNGKAQILIVTDLAARGIDIPLLDNVINYDFPSKSKLFIHRVGRVARAGRAGRAFNLVSVDELPYMVDVFKFLDKPLISKPISNELFDPNDPNTTYYGKVPSNIIEMQLGTIERLHRDDFELQTLRKSVKNGMGLYLRTRNDATSESVKKVKQLPPSTVHPFFTDNFNNEEEIRDNMINQMKAYKPNLTIFEVKNASRGGDTMKNKRQSHEEIIAKKQQFLSRKSMQTAEDEHNEELSHRSNKNEDSAEDEDSMDEMDDDFEGDADEDVEIEEVEEKAVKVVAPTNGKKIKRSQMKDFKSASFISEEPLRSSFADKQYSINENLNDMVLDLQDDSHVQRTAGDGRDTRVIMKWDRLKKKYVREQVGGKEQAFSSKLKDDMGNEISSKDHGKLYEKWKKKSRQAVPMAGSLDAGDNGDHKEENRNGHDDGGFAGPTKRHKKNDDDRSGFNRDDRHSGGFSRGGGRGGGRGGFNNHRDSGGRTSGGGFSRGNSRGRGRGGSRGGGRDGFGRDNDRHGGRDGGDRNSNGRKPRNELKDANAVRKSRKEASKSGGSRGSSRGGSRGRGSRGRGRH